MLAIGTLALSAEAQDRHGAHEPVPREVIALTSTLQDNRSSDFMDHVHDRLQAPLNHLGMVVHAHDVSAGPPTHLDLRRIRAVITFFQGGEPPAEWLWPWIERAADEHDLRFVHFGDFGPLEHSPDGAPGERLTRWLTRFGLAHDSGYVGDPLRVQVDLFDRRLSSYESLPAHQRAHLGPWSWGADNRVWVRTSDGDELGDARTPVVTGPWGGVALAPWALHEGWRPGDFRWYIDPFRFFEDALGLQGIPAPDPSVLNGRRMLVLHIDGDGFESLSTVHHGQLSAKVMLDEVLDRYRLPVTVSVIVASLTDDLAVETPTAEMLLAREIFARPYVEPATHTVLHPQDWRQELTPRSLPRSVVWYPPIAGYRHDMVAEVTESIRFVNDHLLTDGRRCEMVLWSGMCNPSEQVLAAAAGLGCWNINGGEFRWDPLYDSVGFVSPWGKQLGPWFQVYCGSANENAFDGFFTTMPGAFAHIDKTIENAGSPRILKPANVYFHFYSAERPARLRALKQVIERWALREPTSPVHASTYARAVHAAQTGCRIARTPGGWSFTDFGACRTVRFDGESRSVDWARSSGLIGARQMQGALYVHLAGPEAELVWARPGSLRPHVEQANHPVRRVRLQPDGVELESETLVDGQIVLAGFPPHVAVTVDVDGDSAEARTDDRGRLSLQLPNRGTSRVQVRVR